MLLPLERLLNGVIEQLRIGTESFVAKKLVNIGSGRSEELPLSKAISVLTADLIRIKRMAYFADKFKAVADDQQTHIAGKMRHPF